MNASLTIDTSGFQAALRSYKDSTTRGWAEIVQQRALNVAARAYKLTPPQGEGASGLDRARDVVKAYWNTIKSVTRWGATENRRKRFHREKQFRFDRTGKIIRNFSPSHFSKPTVKVGRKKSRASQFKRKHLLANALLKKSGRKGAWGGPETNQWSAKAKRMSATAGGFGSIATRSVGYLKVVWRPVMRALAVGARFKPNFGAMPKLSIWPGSLGSGTAVLPKKVNGFTALLKTVVNVDPSQYSKVSTIQHRVLQRAINEEAAEMVRHVKSKLKTEYEKIKPSTSSVLHLSKSVIRPNSTMNW